MTTALLIIVYLISARAEYATVRIELPDMAACRSWQEVVFDQFPSHIESASCRLLQEKP